MLLMTSIGKMKLTEKVSQQKLWRD